MMKALALFLIFGFAQVATAAAMTFNVQGSTVHASGPIEHGDAARFAALPKFTTLELDSPGGFVQEALDMVGNMDARGNVRTVVRSGASCASACGMALFVSGKTRIVYMGGKIGIHSCANADGSQADECTQRMASNATAHGVPWGVIEGFGKYTKPSSMTWLSAEDAECWGMMKWNASDTSSDGMACFMKNVLSMKKERPAGVTAANANDVLCRLSAPASRIYVPNGDQTQGFSDGYRAGCERVAADPKTPKYAAIDIILWLTVTDPNVRALKPGTLLTKILGGDENQSNNCWKCLTIIGMTQADYGFTKEAMGPLIAAAKVAQRDTGSVPSWLNRASILLRPMPLNRRGSSRPLLRHVNVDARIAVGSPCGLVKLCHDQGQGVATDFVAENVTYCHGGM